MPTNTVSPVSEAEPTRTTLPGWLAVVAVTTGIFSIVTTEILPIGLLTSIGASFQVSDGTAGLMMTLPGILAAIAAPAVTVTTGRLGRRVMLCALMLLLAVADFLSAAAPAYWVMLVSRVLVGLVIGAFWSIGAGLAPRLVRPARVGTATAVIFSAVPLGSVLGVPAGTLIGDLAGWRMAFVAMGVLTVGVFAALVAFVPPLPAGQVTRSRVLAGMFGRTGARTGLAVTFLVVLAHFGAYTYVTPFLEQVTHLGPSAVTAVLLIYGGAGIAGNFVAGTVVSRGVRGTLAVSAGMLAVATLLLPVIGRWGIGAVVLLVVWGVAYGAVPVCSQTWFARSAPETPEAASVLFTSSFQATISLGAWAGGVVLDATSPSTVMGIGGVAALLTVLTVLLSPSPETETR
ncbi:MFS transporter [Streptoalloteichus hindustanus]|uniref:Predicted arabinose efflux permease, MFS family n=1 Tax=Streptoalloteichus hindustanus TaxID=2017 RepID=A0A1M4ZG83_STRHI|nr:MFS transporter [Streptoalloteichus hindustanus]SHF16985.1 Predicted arabinose efflux permease, MFS family [Streptoalloteichus hindustanus]